MSAPTTKAQPLPPGWGPGRVGVLYAVVWLFFLVPSLQEAWRLRDTVRGWLGLVSTVAFAVAYVGLFGLSRRLRRDRMEQSAAETDGGRGPVLAALWTGLVLLAVVVCATVGEQGLATTVYLAVASIMVFSSRAALVVTVVTTVAAQVATRVVPGWEADLTLAFATLVAAFAMWGVTQLMRRNAELFRAREENQRLAVEEERNRLARDLHDILGHSLTVITVKAELAGRLVDVDPVRARVELSDLERLSRDALADVRRAVEGYREVTLPGELARARMGLSAAGIEADLPNSTDVVPGQLREIFAWAVREGVTNVIRHSGASRCTVVLADDRVEVADDGRGAVAAAAASGAGGGHGLLGLRERAANAGATVLTRTLEPHGFSLSVVARDDA